MFYLFAGRVYNNTCIENIFEGLITQTNNELTRKEEICIKACSGLYFIISKVASLFLLPVPEYISMV